MASGRSVLHRHVAELSTRSLDRLGRCRMQGALSTGEPLGPVPGPAQRSLSASCRPCLRAPTATVAARFRESLRVPAVPCGELS